MVDAGAETQQPVTDVGGGKLIASVRDADGNVTGLAQTLTSGRHRDDDALRGQPVGHVESTLADRRTAPKQEFEGAPDTGWCSSPRWRRPSATWPSAATSWC